MRKKVNDSKNTISFHHFVFWIFLNFQLTVYTSRYKRQLALWARNYQAKEGGKEISISRATRAGKSCCLMERKTGDIKLLAQHPSSIYPMSSPREHGPKHDTYYLCKYTPAAPSQSFRCCFATHQRINICTKISLTSLPYKNMIICLNL